MKQTLSRTHPDLREWRKAQNFSTYRAADYLGLSQSRYSRLERKKAVVTGPELQRIIDLTGVPVETLVGAA